MLDVLKRGRESNHSYSRQAQQSSLSQAPTTVSFRGAERPWSLVNLLNVGLDKAQAEAGYSGCPHHLLTPHDKPSLSLA